MSVIELISHVENFRLNKVVRVIMKKIIIYFLKCIQYVLFHVLILKKLKKEQRVCLPRKSP